MEMMITMEVRTRKITAMMMRSPLKSIDCEVGREDCNDEDDDEDQEDDEE